MTHRQTDTHMYSFIYIDNMTGDVMALKCRGMHGMASIYPITKIFENYALPRTRSTLNHIIPVPAPGLTYIHPGE